MASEGQEPQQGQYSAQDGQYPDAGYEAAPGSQYAEEQGSHYGEGQEYQNDAGYEGGQYAEDQGSQYYGDQYPGQQDYQTEGEEGYPDYPDSQYAEGSQYVGDERYPGEEGSQYPDGQYYGEDGYQYAGQEGLLPEEGVGEHFEKAPPKRGHPHFGEPPEDEPEQVTEGILDVALGEVTGEPNPETSEGAAYYILKNMLKDVGDEADEHALQKKYGKQYQGPEKPTDMKICDKYFIKPGEFGVSSDLFPGTGERPPNASIDEFQFPDDIKAKGDSLASFLELIDKCSVEFPEKEGDRESESDMELDAYDSEYIKNTVGIPLTLALAEIVAKKPTDPIHFLGHWLYKWRYNQEAKQAEIDKITDLIAEREALAEAEREKQRLADEKIALQLIDNIMDDVMDASKKRRGEDYLEEEGEGELYRGWYGGDTGDGEGYYGQYPPDYPQQGSGQYPAQGYDQYPPQQYDQNPVQGYEQFPPEEQQYMPQEQQQQY